MKNDTVLLVLRLKYRKGNGNNTPLPHHKLAIIVFCINKTTIIIPYPTMDRDITGQMTPGLGIERR